MPVQTERTEVDLFAVIRAAVGERKPGEDTDAALRRACAELCPDTADRAFQAVTFALDALAKHQGTDRETVLRLAAEQGIPSLASGPIRVSSVTVTSRDGSPVPLPREIGARVRKMVAAGRSGATFTFTRSVSTATLPMTGVSEMGKGKPCPECGYAPDAAVSSCPRCGRQVKRSFWARIFGG